MKSVVRILGLCALVALTATSCKKNENNTAEGNMSFKATINQPVGNSRTHIGEYNGQANWLLWNNNDQIKVYTAEGTSAPFSTSDANAVTANFSGTIDPSAQYCAFYPASKAGNVNNGTVTLTLDAVQDYAEGSFANGTYPMAAYTTGTEFEFHSPCGVLAIPMKGSGTIGSIELTGGLNEPLAGNLVIDLAQFDPANPSAGGYAIQPGYATTITLDCGSGVALGTTPKMMYFVVPRNVFSHGFTAVVKGVNDNVLETLSTTRDNTIPEETIIVMPEVTVVVPPQGAIWGAFSVSDDDQVWFAKGNLQYTRTSTSESWDNGTWSFMENQWDRVESSNFPESQYDSNEHSYYINSTTVSLLGWGTSGCPVRPDLTDYFYQPWQTDSLNEDWGHGFEPRHTSFGPLPTQACNLTGAYANADWGVYNRANITNADPTVEWYTLSKDEWNYVISLRTTANGKASVVNGVSDARYAKAIVNGVNGLILFPDIYTHPTGVTQPTGINVGNASFGSNSYSGNDWTAMEQAGCVFLPAGGNRYGFKVFDYNRSGDYWSTTGQEDGVITRTYALRFSVNQVGVTSSGHWRADGDNVRLACPAYNPNN